MVLAEEASCPVASSADLTNPMKEGDSHREMTSINVRGGPGTGRDLVVRHHRSRLRHCTNWRVALRPASLAC